ncbi:hypothetical protein [Pontibacillus marinus]|uniref:Uncharacterized protein n=1 Tax=Pontibacillus marinus BH030004 = DSM 16465 TaxID=1385511 RepID=A0A0A5GBT1_9BACI|nr:hypothetical protein [Pontibacillus marinus]KGX89479.1 hypothetical protein N783_06050 [Pontibacillus marinus BH030004 = DSM 16465]
MNKNKWIKLLLVLSLISNTIFFYLVFNMKSNNENQEELLKNAIIINEFSERAKEWRNFNGFIKDLSKQEMDSFPVSEKQANMYWELANPMESVVSKSTEYILKNEYSSFIISFDKKYEDVINAFKEKLPLMKKEQVISLEKKMDEAYKNFIGKGEWSIRQPQTKINIDFKKENLNLVIEQLTSIDKKLQSIE